MTPTVDTFRGCFLGAALGDALARSAEPGDDPPYDLARENPAPIGAATQQTLCVAEGLIRGVHRVRQRGIGAPAAHVEMALQRWQAMRGSADTTQWLFEESAMRADRGTAEPAARAAPFGLGASDAKTAAEYARDPAAACVATAIWHLARGASLPDALASITRVDHLALAAAFASVAAFERFEPTLWRAAQHGSTAAAITGALLGAHVGHTGLPSIWLPQLELAALIDRVATDFHLMMIGGRVPPGYPPS